MQLRQSKKKSTAMRATSPHCADLYARFLPYSERRPYLPRADFLHAQVSV
jgi:hypothetical protein